MDNSRYVMIFFFCKILILRIIMATPVLSCLENNNNQGMLPSGLKTLVFAIYNAVGDDGCDCIPSNQLIDLDRYGDRTICRDVLIDSPLYNQAFPKVFNSVVVNSYFQNLFFSPATKGYFISPSQKYNPAVLFSSQKITNLDDTSSFSLFDTCCEKYIDKNGCIPDALKLIHLTKELSNVKSLYDLKCNVKALNYNDIIDYYTSTNQIKKQECKPDTQYIALPLGIRVNYYSVSLDVDFAVQFNYLVSLPGYELVRKNVVEMPLVSPADIDFQVQKTSVLSNIKSLSAVSLEGYNSIVQVDFDNTSKLYCELNNVSEKQYNSNLKTQENINNYVLSKYEQNKSLELIQPLVCSIANNYEAEKNYQLSQIEVYNTNTCLNKVFANIEGTQKQLGLDPTVFSFPPLDLGVNDYLTPLNVCMELNPPQIQKLTIVPPPLNDCGCDGSVDDSLCDDTDVI